MKTTSVIVQSNNPKEYYKNQNKKLLKSLSWQKKNNM